MIADDLIFQPSLMDLDLGRVHMCLVWSKYVEQDRHTREFWPTQEMFSVMTTSVIYRTRCPTLFSLPGVPA